MKIELNLEKFEFKGISAEMPFETKSSTHQK